MSEWTRTCDDGLLPRAFPRSAVSRVLPSEIALSLLVGRAWSKKPVGRRVDILDVTALAWNAAADALATRSITSGPAIAFILFP